ncbi:MAG: hypothetical protein OXH86_06945 [Acidimicrobiaceae bacterium]|nr:hypothetical protein [Acidimicrobiaceae bacterium]MDE0497071.1 hypothetical protein [Acidimicrobiaceae bacterium]
MTGCDGQTDPEARRGNRSGQNAVERGVDPRGLCSICAEPFTGFDLHEDHVMPIGARGVDEGLVLVRIGDAFVACLRSEAPGDGEVFAAVPCAALAHARCNMSKGATRDIERWRHPDLPLLIVGVSGSGARVAVPGPRVLAASAAWDWTDAQREAHDRGVEALRRRGHRSARSLKTTAEQLSEKLRLEREHHRAEVEATADDMIRKAEAGLAQMSDWREVRDANERIAARTAQARAEWAAMPHGNPPSDWFEGCLEHDAAQASLRRWDTTQQLGQARAADLFPAAVEHFRASPAGRAEAARLDALAPAQRVSAFNRSEREAARTKRPDDRAKAQLAYAAIKDLDVHIGHSAYYDGRYAKLTVQPVNARTITYLDEEGRVIARETGDNLRTDPRRLKRSH